MHRSLRYLKSGAKALSKVLARSVANGMGWPEHAVEIPVDLAWEWGEQLYADLSVERTSEQQRQDYLEVIKPGPDYTDDELIEAVNAGFLDAPEPVRMTALALLGQIQSLGRQSLRRLDDPSGTTLPPSLRFNSVEDHAARLPNALPRYNVGDTPIQGYVLAERLGVGGFGEVWKAHNPKRPNLAVALKFFTDAKARSWLASHEADVLERIQTEVRHPGIVRLQNVYDDLACLQFEFVKGWTLSRQILDWHAQGTPDPMFIAGEFKRIVEILVDVHDRPEPIVHRDLKPANILVEALPDGRLNYRITDFGIGGFAAGEVARKTRLGTLGSPRNPSLLRGAHSPLYASDEQKKGLGPDPRDDIFSLGVLWFQMQTGRLDSGPPTGFGWSDELQKQGMSEGLVRLMALCFESNSIKRPSSAKVLVQKLDARLEIKSDPVKARVEPVSPPPRKVEQARLPEAPIGENAISYAGFCRRFLAVPADLIVAIILPFVCIGMIYSYNFKPEEKSTDNAVIGVMIFLNATFFWYHVAMGQSKFQATLGKMVFGMKVTNTDGRRISFFRSLTRTLFKIVSLAPYGVPGLLVTFTPKKQGLHDLIARTLVVKVR